MDDRSKRSHRTGHRVASEHRRLDSLFRRTRARFVPSSAPGTAAEAFGELREAVDGHLAQEDTLYYPPIWALRPEYKAPLQTLVRAHDDFRRRLAAIATQVVRGMLDLALADFDAFVEDFGRHEAGEEQLLERIERELAPSA